MKAAFQVSEQHVERFRQASVRIRECLSAVEEGLPPDAGVWREAAIAGLLQAYGAMDVHFRRRSEAEAVEVDHRNGGRGWFC